jgi:hypothetical protein
MFVALASGALLFFGSLAQARGYAPGMTYADNVRERLPTFGLAIIFVLVSVLCPLVVRKVKLGASDQRLLLAVGNWAHALSVATLLFAQASILLIEHQVWRTWIDVIVLGVAIILTATYGGIRLILVPLKLRKSTMKFFRVAAGVALIIGILLTAAIIASTFEDRPLRRLVEWYRDHGIYIYLRFLSWFW